MIIEKARELGLELSQSQEYAQLVKSRELLESDNAILEMIAEFQTKQKQIVDILSEDEPDKDYVMALTHDVDSIQAMLLGNKTFNDMLEAQNKFNMLLQQVNSTIYACVGMDTANSGSGSCSGSCSTCSGCVH